MASLSSRTPACWSNLSVNGSLQFRPPSAERETCTAWPAIELVSERLTWYAVPLGAIVTHGSDARTNLASPPVQAEKGAAACVQVRPPSCVTAVSRPLAPPFDQRSRSEEHTSELQSRVDISY